MEVQKLANECIVKLDIQVPDIWKEVRLVHTVFRLSEEKC
jgi:hypothetical protein